MIFPRLIFHYNVMSLCLVINSSEFGKLRIAIVIIVSRFVLEGHSKVTSLTFYDHAHEV